MCPRHCCQIDGFAVLVMMLPAVALIVSEAVLDPNNNPVEGLA